MGVQEITQDSPEDHLRWLGIWRAAAIEKGVDYAEEKFFDTREEIFAAWDIVMRDRPMIHNVAKIIHDDFKPRFGLEGEGLFKAMVNMVRRGAIYYMVKEKQIGDVENCEFSQLFQEAYLELNNVGTTQGKLIEAIEMCVNLAKLDIDKNKALLMDAIPRCPMAHGRVDEVRTKAEKFYQDQGKWIEEVMRRSKEKYGKKMEQETILSALDEAMADYNSTIGWMDSAKARKKSKEDFGWAITDVWKAEDEPCSHREVVYVPMWTDGDEGLWRAVKNMVKHGMWKCVAEDRVNGTASIESQIFERAYVTISGEGRDFDALRQAAGLIELEAMEVAEKRRMGRLDNISQALSPAEAQSYESQLHNFKEAELDRLKQVLGLMINKADWSAKI